jgi:chemotaxis family two-component system response regulator PixG
MAGRVSLAVSVSCELDVMNTFVKHLQTTSQMQFTGCLEVQVSNQPKRRLYCHTGRLVWATGGTHRVRRWRRCLSVCCPQLNLKTLRLQEAFQHQEWEYWLLTDLVRQQQVTREQAIALIEMVLTETIFDVIQESQIGGLHFIASYQNYLKSPIAVFNPAQITQRSQALFNTWSDLGLMEQSPNLAPVISKPDELRQRTSPKTYQLMMDAMNGNATLRELAIVIRQDLITLVRSLLPYIRQGLISLVEIPDLATSNTFTASNQPVVKNATGARIVCVDDSVRVCQEVGSILTQAGYQFISVQDSIQALPILLENKPHLILLDLVMPVANGYEICSQIRRISVFRQTPIVILTGKDGIVDRVRAKMVGASDFLAKPVEAAKLLSVVQKHLMLNLEYDTATAEIKVQPQLG